MGVALPFTLLMRSLRFSDLVVLGVGELQLAARSLYR